MRTKDCWQPAIPVLMALSCGHKPVDTSYSCPPKQKLHRNLLDSAKQKCLNLICTPPIKRIY